MYRDRRHHTLTRRNGDDGSSSSSSSDSDKKKKKKKKKEGKKKPEPPKDTVTHVNNHVYFYGDVERKSGLALVHTLRRLADEIRGKKIDTCECACACQCATCRAKRERGRIFLHINSHGGSLNALGTILAAMRSSPVPITTIVEGEVASAGATMAIFGTHRQMDRHAYLLIHQLSDGFSGTFEELKDEMANDRLMMDDIRAMYLERTKIPMEDLVEILKHDRYWPAKKCLELGLIDEII
jgi:ATP-dependent protease ClpP protease subunit